nr:MAG TPA: hypothetical protein [Caudoviricetes sp.]
MKQVEHPYFTRAKPVSPSEIVRWNRWNASRSAVPPCYLRCFTCDVHINVLQNNAVTPVPPVSPHPGHKAG